MAFLVCLIMKGMIFGPLPNTATCWTSISWTQGPFVHYVPCCLEYLLFITLPVTLATGVFGHPILAFISALFTAALVVRVLLRLDFQNYLLNFRFSKKATKTDEISQYLLISDSFTQNQFGIIQKILRFTIS